MTRVECCFVTVPVGTAVIIRCVAQFGGCHRAMVLE